MKKQIVFILGTRPEVVKLSQIIKKLRKKIYIINTGQHRELADQMLHYFKIVPDLDLGLMKENQSIGEFIGDCYGALFEVFKLNNFKKTVVLGDTNTALVGGLIAKYFKSKLIHIEAGLRSFDVSAPYPEELNRIYIDHLSDILICPTKGNADNLNNERVKGKIFITGNPIVDVVNLLKDKVEPYSEEEYVLLTVHRRESFGEPIKRIFRAVNKIANRINVIYPTHPNPNIRKHLRLLTNVKIIEPVDYLQMLGLIQGSKVIITDSGGLQEEAPSFSKPVIIVRDKTERPEIVGRQGLIIGTDENRIYRTVMNLLHNKIQYKKMTNLPNPFGDGKATPKIIRIIRNS